MTGFIHALRAAIRRMLRQPRFSLTIGGIFALGLGANAVMFGILDELLLRPPAGVSQPDELRRVLVERRSTLTGDVRHVGTLSYPVLADMQDVPGVSGAAAYVTSEQIVGRHEEAYPAQVTQVTGDYFGVLGAGVYRGRPLLPADDEVGAEPVAVISYGLWQTRFGGAEDALGRTLDLRGKLLTIVGIAPRGFAGVDLDGVDVWTPLHAMAANATYWEDNRGFHWLRLLVRLEAGVDPGVAEERATAVYRSAHAELAERGRSDPDAGVLLASVIAARGPLASGESRIARWLLAVSLLVLMIACANVANLLLARATARSGETGVRLALGASRRRLVLESIADAMLPAALGAAGALLLAEWAGGLARSILLPDVAWGGQTVDARLVGFVVALTLLSGLTVGALTGIRAANHHIHGLISRASPGATRRDRAHGALAVVQTGLSVVLLVGAVLFLRSLDAVRDTDFGFDGDHLLVARPIQDGSWQSSQERAGFFETAKERIARLPGVAGVASAAMTTPFGNQLFLSVTRGAEAVPEEDRNAFVTNVSPGYFRTLGMTLSAGRGIRETDHAGAPPVAVVNSTLAARYWGGENPLGRCIALEGMEGGESACVRVVGLVEDAKRRSFQDEPFAQVFLASAQDVAGWGGEEVLFVRVAGREPGALAPLVRTEMINALPRLRYAQVESVLDLVDPLARPWRLGATMFAAFGLLALVVTTFGLYSLIAFDVARRSRELAIRSALGASKRLLLGTVVSRGLALATLGLASGLAVVILAAPAVADLLYETDAVDPATFGLVGVVLLTATLFASWVPGRRVLKADPAALMRTN